MKNKAKEFREAEDLLVRASDAAFKDALEYNGIYMTEASTEILLYEKASILALYSQMKKIDDIYFLNGHPNFKKFENYTFAALNKIDKELASRIFEIYSDNVYGYGKDERGSW